jgi:preprotein translocase subunit SecG
MELLFGILVAFHVLVSVLLIVLVLLQPGRGGGGMGAVFGGGSTTSVFGGRGAATFLSKGTGILAAVFFALSILIALTGSERSVTSDAPVQTSAPLSAPATPSGE